MFASISFDFDVFPVSKPAMNASPMDSRGFSLIQETGPMLPAILRSRALAASGLND